MALIHKPDAAKLVPGSRMGIDSMEVPSFRFLLSKERRTTQNILIRTPFALGDCICAEPAIRYANLYFTDCAVSLVTPYPDVFRHLSFKKVYWSQHEKPNWNDYYVFECYHQAEALQSEFVHNFNMAIDDYIAVSLFKGQIPVAHRNIIMIPRPMEYLPPQDVVIHAGKHWVSKTFPKKWWDAVIHGLITEGIKPTLVGAKIEDGKRGYVEVDADGCEDWRDKLTIMQSVSALQSAKVVLTNDSAPYHMAASGSAHIGVFSTVRHIDFIGHWRPDESNQNRWNHKIENLAHGSMWNEADVSPARNGAKYDVIDHATLMSWLPEPEFVVHWTLKKLK